MSESIEATSPRWQRISNESQTVLDEQSDEAWGKGANARALEDQINAWLRENPRIKVLDIKQTASGGSFGPSLWLISIWHKERTD
jgi:hypothetical protein